MNESRERTLLDELGKRLGIEDAESKKWAEVVLIVAEKVRHKAANTFARTAFAIRVSQITGETTGNIAFTVHSATPAMTETARKKGDGYRFSIQTRFTIDTNGQLAMIVEDDI